MIECRNIHKSYGAIAVLKGISISVAQGETFALIGPNGAGKTTFFKVLTGETPANSGSILFKGEEISRLNASARVHRGFGRTFQVARILPGNTVLENLVIAVEARLRNQGHRSGFGLAPGREIVEEAASMARRTDLDDKLHQLASFLSHGDRKRLELGITLSLRPSVLMMDEPTAGMSPSDRRQTIDIILKLRAEEKLTILLTEHDMDVVFGLSDRIMVMNQGEPVAVGTIGEIRTNAAVREIYLGQDDHDA
ncbi:ABC transporter ATP-binding protein [Corticibacterium sp. UT-5YL-CI-8]|nr:ABC transporter ATP-binding protein [Tianweitania sp. UT-5YL-CI-8]